MLPLKRSFWPLFFAIAKVIIFIDHAALKYLLTKKYGKP
jgi:hypothetical protein